MSAIYDDLTSDDYASGVVLADGGLMTTLATNDQAVAERLFQLDFTKGDSAGNVYPAWETVLIKDLWVPDSADLLHLVFESWHTSGAGASYLRALLGAFTSNEIAFTSTTPTFRELLFTGIAAARNSQQQLSIQVSGTGAGDGNQLSSAGVIAAWFSQD